MYIGFFNEYFDKLVIPGKVAPIFAMSY